MTYYPDLSPYEYTPDRIQAYNVGWLEKKYSFPTGSTSAAFRERLLEYCHSAIEEYYCLGYHDCGFCTKREGLVWVPWEDGQISLGNGEIRVIGTDAVYAAPTLIYHYVVDHDYLPPEEFVEAVLTGPGPGSDEYQILHSMIKGTFSAPALPPEVEHRLFHQGGGMEAELTVEELSHLLDEARAGRSLTVDQLAQLLRTFGSQLEVDEILGLLLNTRIKYTAARHSLKRTLETYSFGPSLSLDEIVQIYQSRDELVEPQKWAVFASLLLDDLRAGNWDLCAPLPYLLKEYALAGRQGRPSR